jgi:hypothetical protein
MKEIRIKIGKEKYLIWNKGLYFGEDTPNEDLWHNGYEYRCKKILGIKFIIANKRK